MTKSEKRLHRFFDKLERKLPAVSKFLAWLRKPSTRLYRIPLAVLLMLGGIFSILPGLGIWMLPLGLLLLAIDLPLLQGPMTTLVLRFQRWWSTKVRQFKEWKRTDPHSTSKLWMAGAAIAGPLAVLLVGLYSLVF